jgi:hypothetical protein
MKSGREKKKVNKFTKAIIRGARILLYPIFIQVHGSITKFRVLINFILILGRFAKAKLLRMSYTERNNIIKFANLFRFGILQTEAI